MKLRYPLHKICARCGTTYGEHRDSDERCPPTDEETIDQNVRRLLHIGRSKWQATTFEPLIAGQEDIS
jgi:hypothetical protein